MKYPKNLIEFQRYAKAGDKLLNTIIDNLLKSVNDLKTKVLLHNYLNSNTFLINGFDLRYNLKNNNIFNWTNESKLGDLVEARLYWFYINYGLDYVIKIVVKAIKRTLNLKLYLL